MKFRMYLRFHVRVFFLVLLVSALVGCAFTFVDLSFSSPSFVSVQKRGSVLIFGLCGSVQMSFKRPHIVPLVP